MRTERGANLNEIEAVYRDHFPQFRRVAAAITGDREETLDVVQEAFGTAIRRRKTFRGDGPLEAWIWRVVVNTATDHRRPRVQSASAAASASQNGHVDDAGAVASAIAPAAAATGPFPALLRRPRLRLYRPRTRHQTGNGRRNTERSTRIASPRTQGGSEMTDLHHELDVLGRGAPLVSRRARREHLLVLSGVVARQVTHLPVGRDDRYGVRVVRVIGHRHELRLEPPQLAVGLSASNVFGQL